MALGDAGRRAAGAVASLAVVTLLSARTDAQTPPPLSHSDPGQAAEPAPAPTPTPSPQRLRLDIDRLVKERLEQEQLPRFETEVEVVGKAPQVMLDRFLKGIESDCRPGGAPPGGGAPTHIEMRAARWHPSPSADFQTALVKLIGLALKGKRGEDRYFLYRVNAKGDVSYLLREGRLPEAMSYATPGTTYELIKAYADAKSGATAWRRMERGFASPDGSSAPPPADWQISTCAPGDR